MNPHETGRRNVARGNIGGLAVSSVSLGIEDFV